MALVLCTGVHTTLVHTRKLMLEKADHTVVTALDHSSLIAACQQHTFDVAVICQSGSPELKREWLQLIRKHRPSAKVLEVYAKDSGVVLNDADSWLESPAPPSKLIGCLAALTGEKNHSAKRRAMLLDEARALCARAVREQGTDLDLVLQDLAEAIDLLLEEDAKRKTAGS